MSQVDRVENHDNGSVTRYQESGFTDTSPDGTSRSLYSLQDLDKYYVDSAPNNPLQIGVALYLGESEYTHAELQATYKTGEGFYLVAGHYSEEGSLNYVNLTIFPQSEALLGDVPTDTQSQYDFFSDRTLETNALELSTIVADSENDTLGIEGKERQPTDNYSLIEERLRSILGNDLSPELFEEMVHLIDEEIDVNTSGESDTLFSDELLERSVIALLMGHFSAIIEAAEIDLSLSIDPETRRVFFKEIVAPEFDADSSFEGLLELMPEGTTIAQADQGEKTYLYGEYPVAVEDEDGTRVIILFLHDRQIRISLPQQLDVTGLIHTVTQSPHDGGWEEALKLINAEVIE